MGLFSTEQKEMAVGLTPHGREALETDAVELNRVETDIMWYLKENSARSIKTISRGIGSPYATVRYAVGDLMKKKLVEIVS